MSELSWEDFYAIETDGFTAEELDALKVGLQASLDSLDEEGLKRAKIIATALKKNELRIPILYTDNPDIVASPARTIMNISFYKPPLEIPGGIRINPKNVQKEQYLSKLGNLVDLDMTRTGAHEPFHMIYPEDEENKIVERTNAALVPLKGTKYYSEERFGYFFKKSDYKPHLKFMQHLLQAYSDKNHIDERELFDLNKELTKLDSVTMEVSPDGRQVKGNFDYSDFTYKQRLGGGEKFTLTPNGIKVE